MTEIKFLDIWKNHTILNRFQLFQDKEWKLLRNIVMIYFENAWFLCNFLQLILILYENLKNMIKIKNMITPSPSILE